MANTLGRRSLLKMVAGAIAGAVVADRMADHVASSPPEMEVHTIKGQVKAIKLSPLPSISTGTIAIGGSYASMYFPKGDQGQILTTNPGADWQMVNPAFEVKIKENYTPEELAALPRHTHSLPVFPQYDERFRLDYKSERVAGGVIRHYDVPGFPETVFLPDA